MHKFIGFFVFATLCYTAHAHAWGDETWVEPQSSSVEGHAKPDYLQQRIETRQQRLETEQNQRDRIRKDMRENDRRIEKRKRRTNAAD